jgi:mannose-6-phosphate isomerase-like protein (cupin superfamily)
MVVKKKDTVHVRSDKPRNGEGHIDGFRYLDNHELSNSLKGFYHNELAVGSSVGFHKHIDDEEIYYILEGEGVVDDNGEEKKVESGDLIYTANMEGHALKNTGDKPLKFLAFIVAL